MDPLAFLTWQFVMFSLFVAAIMFVLRTIIEFAIPKAKTAAVWNSLLLMILPVILGGFLGWVFKAYPYAAGLNTQLDHLAYGSVAGLLSTILFKVIKELLGSKITTAVQGALGAINGTATTTASTVVGSPDAPIAPGEEAPPALDSIRASINKE